MTWTWTLVWRARQETGPPAAQHPDVQSVDSSYRCRQLARIGKHCPKPISNHPALWGIFVLCFVSSAVVNPCHNEGTSSWRRRSNLLIAFLLFLLAALPRVSGIDTAPMQSDEQHWTSRADILFKRSKRLSKYFSTHLGHPGVFPAAVLASGQVAGKAINRVVTKVNLGTAKVSPLVGARLGNSLFSSLLPVLVFLFLISWTGRLEAFCVGALIALGPRAIDLSQLAHIDMIFSVVVTATVMCYLSALRSGRASLKVCAGIFFGLCILSKPTCLALVPAFMLVKAIYRWRWPDSFKEGPIAWSDVWGGVCALAIFVLGYTRMWHHGKAYPQWNGIDRSIPELFYAIGTNLQSGAPAIGIGTILVCVLLYLAPKLKARSRLTWIDHSLALVSVLTASWVVRPQIFETLPLYFIRIFNLTGVKHTGFHGTTLPIPGGYLTLAICDLPVLILIAVLLTPLLFIPKLRRTLTASEQQLWIMGSCVSIVWILFLSTSSKQAWRYAMPIVPQLCILASLSLCALGRLVRAPRFPLAALLLLQGIAVYNTYPKWDLYLSPLAPPAEVAFQIGAFNPRSGQVEALQFLTEESKKSVRSLRVTVFGDGTTLGKEAARWLGADSRRLKLGYYPESKADYILVQGNIEPNDENLRPYLSQPPVYVSLAQGVPVARVYKVGHSATGTSSAPTSGVVWSLPPDESREGQDSDGD